MTSSFSGLKNPFTKTKIKQKTEFKQDYERQTIKIMYCWDVCMDHVHLCLHDFENRQFIFLLQKNGVTIVNYEYRIL